MTEIFVTELSVSLNKKFQPTRSLFYLRILNINGYIFKTFFVTNEKVFPNIFIVYYLFAFIRATKLNFRSENATHLYYYYKISKDLLSKNLEFSLKNVTILSKYNT